MGDDLFDTGFEAIDPVGREKSAGDIDPLSFWSVVDEFGKEGEVFLEEIDVEEAFRMVTIVEDLFSLFEGKLFFIDPSLFMSIGLGFFGVLCPPEGEGRGIVRRDGGEA